MTTPPKQDETVCPRCGESRELAKVKGCTRCLKCVSSSTVTAGSCGRAEQQSPPELRRHTRCTLQGMATNRTVYHVVPNASGNQWVVSRENDDSFREEYRTKQEAEQAAKDRARGQEPSQVKVHKSNGNMDYESTYGDDPHPPAG